MHDTKVENIPQLSTFDPEQHKILVIASPNSDYAEINTIRHELSRKIPKMHHKKCRITTENNGLPAYDSFGLCCSCSTSAANISQS